MIKRFRHCSFSSLIKVRDYVHSKLEDIRYIKQQYGQHFLPNYSVFRKLYANAKKDFLGYSKRRNINQRVVTPEIRTLQKKIRKATVEFIQKKTDLDSFKLQNLQNCLTKEYYRMKNEQFSQ